MKRKSTFLILILIGIMVFGLYVVSADEDDEKSKTKVTVKSGVYAVSTNDSVGGTGEYQTLNSGAEAGFKIEHMQKHAYFKAFAHYFDKDEVLAGFSGDFNRVIRVNGSYNKFLHRLGHDPLTNLQAVKPPKATRYTDLDPNGEYGIVYSRTTSSVELQSPDIPGAKLTFNYDQQNRQGHKQVRTLSHCSNCHVVANKTFIDQVTKDFSAVADYNSGGFTMSAEFAGRTFEENGPTPMHQYDDVLHPTLATPVFFDRVSFSDVDGMLPHNMVPDNNKWTAKLNASYFAENFGVVDGGFVYSEVENEYTDNTMTYNGLRAGYYTRLSNALSLKLKGTYYSIDNDDTFVDIAEPLAVAGPYAGKTYQEKWGYDPDFTRLSVYNRDVLQFDAKALWRMASKTTLDLGYQFKSIDRENFDVTELGDSKTTHNRFKANLTSRLSKATRLNAQFTYEDIDRPFIGVNSSGTPNFNPAPVSSPLAGGSLQYFELYAARVVNLSNQPSSVIDFKGSLTHKLAKAFSVSGKFQYKKSENDVLDFSKWSKEKLSASVSSWFAFSPEFYGMVSYNYTDEETKTLFILPIFDG